MYLDEDGYKQYPSTTYQQKSYWQVNYSKFHKNIPFFKPGCLKLCFVVQGQFLPEAGFAMACHRLPDLVTIIINVYVIITYIIHNKVVVINELFFCKYIWSR